MSGVLSDGPGRPESGEEYWRRAFYETDTDLQRYKDALEACKEVITRLGGCVCDDCIERELAAIQATKDKKGN
jgi:hypothetical protein